MTETATPVKAGPVGILVEIPGLADRHIKTWPEVVEALTAAGYPADNLPTPDTGAWVQHEVEHPGGNQRAAYVEGLVPVVETSGVPHVRPVIRVVAGEDRTFRECPLCHSFIPEAVNDSGAIVSTNYPQHYIESHTGEGAKTTMATKSTDKTSPEAMQAQRDAAAAKGSDGGDGTTTETPAAKPAAKTAARKRAAKPAASNGDGPKRGRPSQYPPEIREAVKIALEIRGAKVGASAKSHQLVRTVVGKILKKQKLDPTPENLATVAGFGTFAEIVAIAEGKSDREAVKKLKPLDEKMGDDKWAKGKQLATALAAWGRQLSTPSTPDA